MDMIAQTVVAAPQTPATVGGTNVSSNKTAAQSLVTGDGKGSKSFTDVLDKTLNPIDKADQPDNTTISLEAMLQGLSPALLMAMLTQGQVSEQGNGEVNGLKLDPATVKALQTLGERSGALNQLIGSGAFQQWLTKVSELLSAMNTGNETKQDLSALLGGNVASHSLADQALPKTAVQAQAILTQFMAALNQNKDSFLFQQLVDNFQEVVNPALAAQLVTSTTPDISKGLKGSNITAESSQANVSTVNFQAALNEFNPALAAQLTTLTTSDSSKGLKGSNKAVSSQANVSIANLQAALNELPGLSSTPTASVSKETGSDLAFKLQIAQATKQFSKLDTLSAKSGLADRMMLAALQSGIGSDDSTSDVQSPMTGTMQLQDLLRTVSTDLVKPMQPMTAQSFVQDMSQFVMKTIKVNELNGFSEARLSLSPANLGHVDVKLTMHNGQLVAHFAAQTVLGKEMLEAQLSQLKQSLQGQGLQVERLEVTQNSSLQSSLFQDQRQQQFTQQFARQNKSKYNDEDLLTQSFSVEMANVASLRSVNGNGFDVTA
jgi:flagellar hook-length control protein FliK